MSLQDLPLELITTIAQRCEVEAFFNLKEALKPSGIILNELDEKLMLRYNSNSFLTYDKIGTLHINHYDAENNLITKIINRNGDRIWWKNYVINSFEDNPGYLGANGDEAYYNMGQLHREGDLPAVKDRTGIYYYVNGRRHRINGPASIKVDGTLEYYVNGLLHREDGAAIIRPNGYNEYWFQGQPIRLE